MAPRTTRSSVCVRFERNFDGRTRARGLAYAADGRVTLTRATPSGVTAIVRGSAPYHVDIGLDDGGVSATCSCPFYAGGEFCKHLWATIMLAEWNGHLQGLLAASPDWRHESDYASAPGVAEDDDDEDDDDEDDDDEDDDDEDDDDEDDDDDDDDGDDEDHEEDADEDDALALMRVGGGPSRAPGRSLLPVPRPELVGRVPPRAPRRSARPPAWRALLETIAAPRVAGPPGSGRPLGGRSLQYLFDLEAARERSRVRLLPIDRWRRPDGAWTEPRAVSLRRADLPALADTADRRLLELLLGATGDVAAYGYGYPYGQPLPITEFELTEAHVAELLPQACRTGRLYLCRGLAAVDDEPCLWDDTPLTVRVRLEERPAGWALAGQLERGAARLPLSAATLLLRGGVVILEGRAARFDFAGDFTWIGLLRAHGEVSVPRADVDHFLEALHASGHAAAIELPAALQPAELAGVPRPVLRLRPARSGYGDGRDRTRLAAALAFAYEDLEIPAGDGRPAAYDRAGRRLIHRDPAAEAAAGARLGELGFRPTPAWRREADAELELPAGKLPRVVPPLLDAGFRVEAEAAVFRAAGRIQVSVTTGADWFDVAGGVTYGDEVVPFPRLLQALKAGERFVRLGDGGFGVLPERWLERAGLLLRAGAARDAALRFTRSQGLLLDALLAAEAEVQADAGFTALRARLQAFSGVALARPPRSFRGQLRPYQRAGLGWLRFLRDHGLGGCLADDMGLGKTVQVLAWLETRRRARTSPSLVVAPRSVLFNWQAEAARFTPQQRVAVHDGPARARAALAWPAVDLVLTTYGILRRDAAALKDVRFDCVILDEAQTIKNATSATAKAARLLKGEQRLALSGTPIENHLGELWSLIEFLNPGMLGSASVFRAALGDGAARDPGARDLLARALRPILLRRTKEHVAPELPARVEQVVTVDLEPAERARYDELRAHYQQRLLGGNGADFSRARFHVLEALLRLRQAACHGGLVDPRLAGTPSAKLELLRARLREIVAEGHKALVFSQFTSFLDLVRRALDRDGIAYEYLDGQTRDRPAHIARFQQDAACPVFLVSLKAGGLGLNLTAAEYVFLLDPWWNPAVEAQAIDRTHRIGQERSVFAYRLVARDTVEEKVLALQQSKRALADAVLRADRSLLQDLTREDLALLLG